MTKCQRDYERVFNKIREITNIAPKHFGVDFEKGLANAVALRLNAKISYCYFYFGQSIWRKIQQIGLSGNYLHYENFNIDVKKIILLAFLPPTVISLEYCKLKAHMINNYEYRGLNDLFNYLERMYIPINSDFEKVNPPVFNPVDWSVHGRYKTNMPRTNNGAEGWHRGLNELINVPQLNIAIFLNKILVKENEENFKFIQLKTGRFKWSIESAKKELKIRQIIGSFQLFPPIVLKSTTYSN
ncbi:hypothetical protein DMUE_5546 [Dictyocoela muelleri]|nr:hypothetical protein DMUE_5546 [Dictyocoela muelleri]